MLCMWHGLKLDQASTYLENSTSRRGHRSYSVMMTTFGLKTRRKQMTAVLGSHLHGALACVFYWTKHEVSLNKGSYINCKGWQTPLNAPSARDTSTIWSVRHVVQKQTMMSKTNTSRNGKLFECLRQRILIIKTRSGRFYFHSNEDLHTIAKRRSMGHAVVNSI